MRLRSARVYNADCHQSLSHQQIRATLCALLMMVCIQVPKNIADYMIAYCFNQSHTERAGKNMTSTKTPDRASLGDTSFKQLVWLSFNAPPIYQINFRPFVERWIKDQEHRLAAQTDGNGSKVIERKKNITKTTILH